MVRKDGITPPIHVFEKNLKNKVKKKNQKTKLCILYNFATYGIRKKMPKKKKRKKKKEHTKETKLKRFFKLKKECTKIFFEDYEHLNSTLRNVQ